MSSPSQHRSTSTVLSSEELNVFSSDELAHQDGTGIPKSPRGRYDDSKVIKETLIRVMKNCGKSRATIANVMSDLFNRQVTEEMLYAFTGARDDRRWPAEFDRAFCKATGDDTLIRTRAEMSGLRIIDQEESDLLELGRAFLQRERANAKIAELQAKYSGGTR